MKPSPLVIDLFCGAGGFSRGFREAGYKIILGIDNDKNPARSFKLNFPEAYVFVEDIKNVSAKLINDIVGYKEVDVVIGGPPCEPFTPTNPRRKPNPLDRLYSDPIGQLVLHYIRLVGELKPKIFIMENVPAIMDGPLKNALRREFARVGYRHIYFNVLRAEDYGTPSHRLRVFISNIEIKPKRKTRRRLTVAEALKNLPPPGTSEIPNHELPPISDRKLRKIAKLKWGKAMILYDGAKGKRYPNLIKLHPHKLAPTVMGSSRFIHPYEDRFLTVREQARLMGFPDNHVFMGGRDEQYNQVGEAVPVPLAKAIAEHILDILRTKT